MELINKSFTIIRKAILIVHVDIDEMLIFNNASYSEKSYRYFTGYESDDCEIKQLCIKLPNISEYVKHFDETKYTLLY